MPNVVSARQIAIQCLCKWNTSKAFAETLVDKECNNHKISHADRHLVQALVYTTLRHKSWFDYIIEKFRKGRLDTNIRITIHIGLCQLFILGIDAHAAVFETVQETPRRAKGLVNAILRSAQRNYNELLNERNTLPLHIRYSTPKWLVERWISQFGENSTTELLQWNETTPRLYVRTNPMNPMGSLPTGLSPLPQAPNWYVVEDELPIDALKAGLLYAADPSTRHAIELLNPQANESILDACAAPGGKSIAILGATHGQAHLTATDLFEHRLPTLKNNLSTQGFHNAEVAQADWSQPCPDHWKQKFDAILLDVPCSNTGVIQRRVDVRWRLSEAEINRLTTLQYQILQQAVEAVKPGGRLVYSTCSIDAEEDSQLIQKFLTEHPSWKLVEERLILPQTEKSDGAYAALLICA